MKRITVVIFLFSCVLYVFPGKLSVLPELRRPHSLVIAGGELYVADGVEVYVYSLSDYQLLRKFGKKGEGPGEFLPGREIPIQLQFFKDLINGNRLNRVYLPSGEMRKVQIGPHMPYSFISGRYYYLVENVDSEEWELHMKEVPLNKNWPAPKIPKSHKEK